MSGRNRRVLLEEPAAGNLHGGVCEGGDTRWCHGGPKRADSAGMNRHGVANERVVKKGLANHLEPESCEGDREATLEALTGAYAGREIELRNR